MRDRVRLEVVFSGGDELYAWPGSERFERNIAELLPAHGLVSDGSYALHMRTLFLRNVATFDEPRRAKGKIELAFEVPAVRSGYAMTTPEGTVPAALAGMLWLDPERLDVEKLEVRVETRLGRSVETVMYSRERIGDAEFVVPQSTDLVMLPEDGMQARNFSRFADYHKFAGTSTVNFGAAQGAESKEPARLHRQAGDGDRRRCGDRRSVHGDGRRRREVHGADHGHAADRQGSVEYRTNADEAGGAQDGAVSAAGGDGTEVQRPVTPYSRHNAIAAPNICTPVMKTEFRK
jgi:hypothetical protein